jgi:putative salt-induced outer membrane protein YdiY
MRSRSFLFATLLAASSSFALVESARADDLPKGSATDAPASKGSTELTAQKFETAGKIEDPEKVQDATELSIGAGAMASAGNARLMAATANGTFRLRRTDNQFSAAIAGNYSRTAPQGAPLETTVQNFQGKARYDRFLVSNLTAFVGTQARNDRFQGLDLRLQIDPGLGYYFVNDAKQLLWAELGYDYLHDVRRDQDRVVKDAAGVPTGEVLDKTNTVHSGRLFLGYDNQLNEAVTFTLGIEYLQGLSSTDVRRLNGDAKLSSKLGAGFSLATSLSLRYDNSPLAGKEKVDTVTAVSLVYKLL